MDTLDTPWGSLALARHPALDDDPLRAFDAADAMVLAHLDDEGVDLTGRIVVLADTWGALGTALAAHRPVVVTDSHRTRRALAENLARNDLDPDLVEVRSPLDPLPDHIDVCLVRLPKAHDRLEHLLRQVRPGLHPGTTVVGAAMARHVHTSGLDLFTGLVGPTRTTRAVRKARLRAGRGRPRPGPGSEPVAPHLDPRPGRRAGRRARRGVLGRPPRPRHPPPARATCPSPASTARWSTWAAAAGSWAWSSPGATRPPG